MSTNRSSVSHTVRVPGFKYDIMKGELSKGCSISKSTHPLPEVELYKQRLLLRNILKDMGDHWILRSNIRTGVLMAVNLHTGQLLDESPYKQDIIVSPEEAEALKDCFVEKQICLTTSTIIMKSIRDTLRLSCVNIMEVNKDIFTYHGSNTFGPDEAFVLKFLQARGIVSSSARHGSTDLNEADIVDPVTGEQYEITYEFKTELPKKQMKKPDRLFDPEIQILQLVDNPFIHTSRSLGKKLTKTYTNRFRSNLVILTFGNKKAVISMLEALSQKLTTDNISHINFANVYIISLDFIDETALFARISPSEPFYSDIFPCKNEELGFIKLTPIDFSTMVDTEKYLIICDGIFDGAKRCRYDSGEEIRKWAKEIRIWGTPTVPII